MDQAIFSRAGIRASDEKADTIVVGIAGPSDLKAFGRKGVKALVYFEVVTTVALFIGLAFVNVVGNCLASVVIARWEGKFIDNYKPSSES